jgi:hypothetical protein
LESALVALGVPPFHLLRQQGHPQLFVILVELALSEVRPPSGLICLFLAAAGVQEGQPTFQQVRPHTQAR